LAHDSGAPLFGCFQLLLVLPTFGVEKVGERSDFFWRRLVPFDCRYVGNAVAVGHFLVSQLFRSHPVIGADDSDGVGWNVFIRTSPQRSTAPRTW
jgi:hypothetical protein